MLSRPISSVRRVAAVLIAGVVLLATASAARADTLYIGDNEAPGMFTGSLTVSNKTSTSAVITITLTNISPSSNMHLTGLAFNDPGTTALGNIANVAPGFSASYSNTQPGHTPSFQLIGGSSYSNSISTGPFGNLDFGASVGSTWHTSGNPANGLRPGETGTFVFTVTGTGLQNLSAANLMNAPSTNGSRGIAIRFRDPYSSANDKDLAAIICPPPPPPPPHKPVPAPPGVVLAGMGLGCMLLGRLRLRRTTSPQA